MDAETIPADPCTFPTKGFAGKTALIFRADDPLLHQLCLSKFQGLLPTQI